MNDGRAFLSQSDLVALHKRNGTNAELICDCGHPMKQHHFRCRAPIVNTSKSGSIFEGRPAWCDCTKFRNPATTVRALHPGPNCPCSACFLSENKS